MTPRVGYSAPSPPPAPPPFDATRAECRLWDLDGPDGSDRRFRRPLFQSIPEALGEEVAEVYREQWTRGDRRAANLMLVQLRERLGIGTPHGRTRQQILYRAYRDEDLRGLARRKSEHNARYTAAPRDPFTCYARLSADALRKGVEPPEVGVQGVTLWGALRRLADEYWWRRALRRAAGRTMEAAARDGGLVHRLRQPYVSNGTLERCRGQRRRTSALLECLEAVNETGESFTLADLQARSQANPANRRNELMVRLAGFQELADERGDVGEFVTITCPSHFHCRRSQDGRPIEQYSGATPAEAQAYLCDLWARIRSALKRRGIGIYGMRVAEPNHDGTPHWHLVVFLDPACRDCLREIVRHYALQEDGAEPGAAKHRATFIEIDRSRGNAVSYAAKYIAKNVDGYGLDDVEGGGPKMKAERIRSWASTWGIRQFQQLGGPPVTIWRELRRAGAADSEELERIRAAADAGDWAEFTRLLGGPLAESKDRKTCLARAWDDQPGRYGEPVGWRTVGIDSDEERLLTRLHRWEIRYTPGKTGPGGEASKRSGQSPRRANTSDRLPAVPWSSVNNCTVHLPGTDHTPGEQC